MSKYFDTLSMLSLKCAPNIFDLSSGLAHVSIRDQVVRAKLLIRDLNASELPCQSLLIVGAGVAGVTAAVEAAAAGMQVTVLDTNSLPFSLQATVSRRYIGPYMYEWPAIFHRPQSFPPKDWPAAYSLSRLARLKSMGWQSDQPMTGAAFARKQREWLSGLLANWSSWYSGVAPPRFLMNVDKGLAKTLVTRFRASGRHMSSISGNDLVSGTWSEFDVAPDFIILAASMGPELVSLGTAPDTISGTPFWAPDDLRDKKKQRIGIFGGGDGALQDFLRALTRFEHPLHFIAYLEADPEVGDSFKGKHAYLLSIEQQSRLFATWTAGKDVFRVLDRQCQGVARELAQDVLIRRKVAAGLRRRFGSPAMIDGLPDDFVFLFVREDHFGKAYLLNRFLVHLIVMCRIYAADEFECRREFDVCFNHKGMPVDPQPSTRPPYPVMINGLMFDRQIELDTVVVRFGVKGDEIPGFQMVGLSDEQKATRTTLSQIPLPFY